MKSAIAYERKKRDLTQAQLAEKLGVQQTTVSEWETKQRIPRREALFKLSALFDKPIDYLLEHEEEPQRTTSSAASARPSAPPGNLARR